MLDAIYRILSSFVSLIVGLVAGYYFAVRRERGSRLYKFRSDISVMRGKIPDDDLKVRGFRDLCSAIFQDIPRFRHLDFTTARRTYYEAPSPGEQRFAHQFIHGKPPDSLPPPMRKTMRDALKTLINCAS